MPTVSEKKVTVAPITLTNVCQMSSQQWCPRLHLLRGCLKATQVQLSWIHFSSVIEETFHIKFEILENLRKISQNFHWKFIILKFFGDFQKKRQFSKNWYEKPLKRNCFVCDYFHLVWKKNLKVEWIEFFSKFFFENFRFYFSFEFLVWKRFTSFYSFW